ncbi:MAG: hypothetical protein SNG69_05515 [Rikenellaceae bacterium]
MTTFKDLIFNNLRMIFLVVSFTVTIYVQHITNTAHIASLDEKCTALEIKIADQYDRIDAIKLDKAVFEANMVQFGSIQSDIREMRADIKELLKSMK